MSALFQRNGWWYLRWFEDGRKRRKALGTKNARTAESLRADHDRQLAVAKITGDRREPAGLADAVRKHLARIRENGSKHYGVVVTGHLRSFLRFHPDLRSADDVKPRHVEEWLDHLAKKRSAVTVNRYRSSLLALFRGLEDRNLVAQVPVKRYMRRKEPRIIVTFLREEECRRMLDAAAGSNLLVPLALGLYAGLRRGEIVALRWDDVNLPKRRLHVRKAAAAGEKDRHTKGRRERFVPIGDELASILEAAPKERNSPFVSLRRRKRWRIEALTRAVAAFGRRLRISALNGPQVLRHTYGCRMAAAGVDMRRIRDLMGHSSLRVTEERYAPFAPKNDAEVSRALSLNGTETGV